MPSSRASAGRSWGRLSTASARRHLPHRAQGAEQRAGDQGLTACPVGRTEVQVLVVHGQGGLAEHPAVEILSVGDDAAAQVDEVAAQGQVAVHVDVGTVHCDGGPVGGNVRRGDAVQQALGTGAGGDVGTAPTAAVQLSAALTGMSCARPRVLIRRLPRLRTELSTLSMADNSWQVVRPKSSAMVGVERAGPVRAGRRCEISWCRTPRR